MKKILSVILGAALIILFVTACQATPEKPVVIQKDMEQMIEKAKETPEAAETQGTGQRALAQRLGVPERFVANESYSDGRLTLAADAGFMLPDASALPTVRVEPADFSQDLVNKIYNYLIGDTEMYQQQSVLTKSQIEEQIVDWQRILNDPKSVEISKIQAEQMIDNLEAQYATALDSPKLIPADATIKQQAEIDFTTGKTSSVYSGVDIAENPGLNVNKGKTFSIRNNTKNGEITVEENIGGWTVTDTASQGARLNYYDYDLISDEKGITYPVETVMLGGLTDRPERVGGFSYQKAIDAAQDFLNKTGIVNMQVDSLTLKYVLPENYLSMMRDNKPKEKAFINDIAAGRYDGDVIDVLIDVNLIRTVNGIQVTSTEYSSYIGDAMFGAQWSYENFTIGVCKDGIYSVSWISPHTITEMVTEDSNLLSFSEIADVFSKMYRVTYDAKGSNIAGEVTLVTLSLRRVMDQNNIGYGLFIPVWDFYGIMTISYPDYPEEPPREWIPDKPFLTINAINGTVIDLDKGY